jgi:hypothetical protein
MSYISEVVVVVRGCVPVPALDLLKSADLHEVRSDCEFWLWRSIDWGFQSNVVDAWLATLDDRDYLLLRDGEEDEDFGMAGRFYESEFYIGIRIPVHTNDLELNAYRPTLSLHTVEIAKPLTWWQRACCWMHVPGTNV